MGSTDNSDKGLEDPLTAKVYVLVVQFARVYWKEALVLLRDFL